jgi:hypothetical protein
MSIIPNAIFLWRLISTPKIIGIGRKVLLAMAGVLAGLLVVAIAFMAIVSLTHRDRVLPGVRIGPVAVGGLSRQQALEAVALAVRGYRSRWPITFGYNNTPIVVSLPPEAVSYDLAEAVEAAYDLGRRTSTWQAATLVQLFKKQARVELPVRIDEAWLASESARIAAEIDVPVIEPSLEVAAAPTGQSISWRLRQGHDG